MGRVAVFVSVLSLVASCQFDPNGAPSLGDSRVESPDAAGADAAPAALDAAPLHCPAGYVHSSLTGTAYFYVAGPILWEPAEMACEAQGTHLVVITDTTERDVVLKVAGASDPGTIDKVWMGLTDRKLEGTWRFVTGAVASEEQLYWNDGQPSGSADCTAFYRSNDVNPAQTGRYDDAPCDDLFRQNGYVCECDGQPVDPSAF